MGGLLTNFVAVVATGLRGLRSRSLLTAGSVLLATIAVAAAVVGPMYQSASAGSYLVTKLREEPDFLTGVTLDFIPTAQTDLTGVTEQANLAVDPSALSHFEPPDLSLWTDRLPVDTLVWAMLDTDALLTAPPDCSGLDVSGSCPSQRGEVLLLKYDADRADASVGDQIEVSGLRDPLTVVGTYRPSTSDNGRFTDPSRWASILPQPRSGELTPYYPAPWVVAPATITSMQPRTWFLRMDYRLQVDAGTTLSDLEQATGEVSALGVLDRTRVTGGSVQVEQNGNALKSVVREARLRKDTAEQTVTPAVLSLILVALVLLVRLLAAAMDLRRAELALASLRGIGRRQLWMLGLLEPVLMLVVAAPLGLAAGYLAARELAAAWLVPGMPLPFGLSSIVFAAGVLAATLAMAAVTVRSALAEPLSTQIAGVRRPVRSSRWGLLARLALIAAAVVVLAATLWSDGRSSPTFGNLALPILLAVATGVLTTTAATTAARWWTRRSTRSQGLTGYLAARTIARRQQGTWVVLPLTVSLAIAVFAGAVYTTAADWRASNAVTMVGDETAFDVKLPLAQTVALTHAVDPDGRWLMAVGADVGVDAATVIVDAPRLARVAVWPDSWTPDLTPAQVGQALSPVRAPLTLTGQRLQLTATNQLAGESSRALISVDVLTSTGDPSHLYVGPFPQGRATRSAPMPRCDTGCQVTGLTITRPGTSAQAMLGRLSISDLSVDGASQPYFTEIGWRAETDKTFVYGVPAVSKIESNDVGLTTELDSRGKPAVAMLTPQDVPPVVPVILGRTAKPRVVAVNGNEMTVATASGMSKGIRVRSVETTESTPYLGPAAMLVDYTMYNRTQPIFDAETDAHILARADTPPAILNELANRGISQPRTLQDVRHTLDQDAYALALNLYLVVTVLVVLLGLSGLALNMAIQIPGRRRDAASLRVVGLPRRLVVTAVAVEFTVLLATAALAGVFAGVLSQYVVVRTITLGYIDSALTPRLLPSLDVTSVAVLLAVVFAVLLAMAVALGGLTVKSARTASLRQSAG